MKRIILIGTAALLLTALACRKSAEVMETPSLPTAEPAAVSAAPASTATDIPITAEPTATPTPIHTPNGAPPPRPVFHSIDEYILLAASVDIDDTECEEYFFKNLFGSGIRTKEDAFKTLELINSLPFPSADGLELEFVELADFRDDFYVAYGIKGDKNSYLSFRMILTGSDAEADREELAQNYPLVELPEMCSPELKFLVRGGARASVVPDSKDTILTFFTNIRSHKVTIQTNLSEEKFMNVLANCEFITMDEYAKKAAP